LYDGPVAKSRSSAALLLAPPAQTVSQSVNILVTCIDATSGLIAISVDDLDDNDDPPMVAEEALLLLPFRDDENPPNVPIAVEDDKQPVKIDLKSGNWSE
jgi:hypothetical protein